MTFSEVQAFFGRYRDAFDALDGDAVAGLWHVPSGIADAKGLTWWIAEAPMRANHRALCAVYREAGYDRAEFEIGHHEPMGRDHAFVRLRWTLRRRDGGVLQQFGTGYQLARTDAGPRILLCTAYEENLKEMTPDAAQ